MASAHTLPIGIDRALRSGMFRANDPGASGTISFHNKGVAICEVVTAGSESRALPNAVSYAVGTRLLVAFKTDGGDLTITGAEASVVLDSAGDVAEFVVANNNGTHVWRVVANTTGAEQLAALPADTSGLTPIPLTSPDADDVITTLLQLGTALVAAGVISDPIVQSD